MKTINHVVICSVVGMILSATELCSQEVRHYVFFNRDRERIAEPTFLEAVAFEGAQLKYMWRELEPVINKYDFSEIEKDLDFLTSHGKKLFIQLQDVTFDTAYKPIPRYLMTDPVYHGGACTQIEVHDDGTTTRFGWVARRWDPAVQERMHKLFDTLGARFDGRIEGINLPETAVDFGIDEKTLPPGFSFDGYRDAVIANMRALKKAFPKSLALLYSNFMPGEWKLPEGRSYLQDLYDAANEYHFGLGGPDLLPYKKGQMDNGYKVIRMGGDTIPAGIAVQFGNFDYINPRTGRKVTIPDMVAFAEEELGVDYIFWSTQEPYYSAGVIPYVASQH